MKQQDGKPRLFSFTLRDFLIFAAIFICALVLCTLLRRSDISDGFASPVFVLAVLLTSRFTNGYLFGTLAAFLSVIGINYIFTFPYWEFNFTMTGYPLTFFVMLCVSLVTCTMTTKIKQQEQFRMESEREKMRANLLRSVSHDIRTPLTSIVGGIDTLLESGEQLSPELRTELLQSIRDESGWLIGIVENLLSVTRVSGAGSIKKELEAGERPAPVQSKEEESEEQMGFADLAGQAVLEELRKVELNTLTPIEAMNLLYGWKAKLDG